MSEIIIKTELPSPFTFSQSSLQDYLDCRRRFQLRYIEQLRWPAVETAPVLENERRQAEGQTFHRLVHQYLLGLPVEKITQVAAGSGSENLSRWWDNFTGALGTSLSGLAEGINFPEHSLSAPAGKHRLLAKYDLINVNQGRAVIYDWKTAQKRPRDEWMAVREQTRVYLSLLALAGGHLNGGKPFAPEQIEMIYWYAEFPTEPGRFAYDTPRREREWKSLTALVNEIAAKRSFPLTDDEKKCGFCPYRSFCERGIQAETGADSEVDEDAAPTIDLEQIQEIEF